MTNINHVDITKKDTFEQSVYAAFPACLYEHVEHELFYNRVDLEQEKMTMQEFKQGVLDTARSHEQLMADLEEDKALFEEVKTLVDEGKFTDASLVAELTREIELGENSLLARFICFQPFKNSLDAALSFLAWKHTKALIELEEAFDINLDHFRSAKEPELFCTSESSMSLINFSVMSQ